MLGLDFILLGKMISKRPKSQDMSKEGGGRKKEEELGQENQSLHLVAPGALVLVSSAAWQQALGFGSNLAAGNLAGTGLDNWHLEATKMKNSPFHLKPTTDELKLFLQCSGRLEDRKETNGLGIISIRSCESDQLKLL